MCRGGVATIGRQNPPATNPVKILSGGRLDFQYAMTQHLFPAERGIRRGRDADHVHGRNPWPPRLEQVGTRIMVAVSAPVAIMDEHARNFGRPSRFGWDTAAARSHRH